MECMRPSAAIRFSFVLLVRFVAISLIPSLTYAAREPVLKQIDLPHAYYFREMFLPQLTSGPSGVAFSPDGATVVYSMAGSLWEQRIDSDTAVELTRGPGYDYQPDWSRDGSRVVFARHDKNAIELWQLDMATKRLTQLTREGAVNLQPRYSPDGTRLAFVSTAPTGHFDLYVAGLQGSRLTSRTAVPSPRNSRVPRYYYSSHDHAINPSWSPDGKQLLFVSNREIAYGSGNLCAIAVDGHGEPTCFATEETSWRANPEMAPDGRRILYSSYQGRQWHQLWLTTLQDNAPLPLTFGDFDRTYARWSPDGRRIAYVSNETGNLTLWVQDVVGGERRQIIAKRRAYLTPMATLHIRIVDAAGRTLPGRVSVQGGNRRQYAPADRWIHADDGFDAQRQHEETRYFHCPGECDVTVPLGDTRITAWRGHEYLPSERVVPTGRDTNVSIELAALPLPAWAPAAVTADMHVHMNYGGHYRHTEQTLAQQAAAEDLDVIYNTIVNKEQRIPDVTQFTRTPFRHEGVTIHQAQEYHTSYWGHLGLLDLQRFLTPDFSAYQRTALTSPYPHNGVIADLAHRQGALVGYVHPYDWEIVPSTETSLTHMFPADAAHGRADYIEIVGFSDHKATAAVWYKLLNLGFRVPAGAGTDAMANYASLRGPVGMNRAYVHAMSAEGAAVSDAIKRGRTIASNGPQLALQIEGHDIGDVISVDSGKQRLSFRAAMRSPIPMEHLEVVQDGNVVASYRFGKERTRADFEGTVTVDRSSWLVLRAWNDGAHPLIFDLYPYATTSPIYVDVAGAPARSPDDAAYFVRWLERTIESAGARDDYNDAKEKEETLSYLRAALETYKAKTR